MLDGIEPIDTKDASITFTTEANDFIKGLSGQSFTIKTTNKNFSIPIPVILKSLSNGSVINDVMVNEGLVQQQENENTLNWNPMETDYTSKKNLPTKSKSFHPAFDNETIEDEKRVCRFFRANGRCARGDNCRYLHVQTGVSFLDNVGDDVNTVVHHEAKMASEESSVDITIPCMRHPESFYVNIMPSREHLCAKLFDVDLSNNELNLAELNKELSRFYNGKPQYGNIRNDTTPLIIGKIVVTKYLDGRWYRSRIIEIHESEFDIDNKEYSNLIERVRVFFVDFGHNWSTDIVNVKRIEDKFLKLPFQAIECTLPNISPTEGHSWGRAACETFRNITKYPLYARVISLNGLRPELLVYAWIEQKWVDVRDELVRLNLASLMFEDQNNQQPSIMIPG